MNIGHNSDAGKMLTSLVERIERLEDEKKSIADDIKDVYTEAKVNGFDTAALRKVIALRKMDRGKREELQAQIDLYMHALGMTPGEALEASGVLG